VRLFLHIKKPHQGLQSSFEEGIDIKFHTFQSKLLWVVLIFYLDAIPHEDNTQDGAAVEDVGEMVTVKLTILDSPPTLFLSREN
jgi:hypothetical protein